MDGDISFRFYEELNDFLPPPRKKREFPVAFRNRNSVKDMIESVGVPHTEVDLILVNGASVDFAYGSSQATGSASIPCLNLSISQA